MWLFWSDPVVKLADITLFLLNREEDIALCIKLPKALNPIGVGTFISRKVTLWLDDAVTYKLWEAAKTLFGVIGNELVYLGCICDCEKNLTIISWLIPAVLLLPLTKVNLINGFKVVLLIILVGKLLLIVISNWRILLWDIFYY